MLKKFTIIMLMAIILSMSLTIPKVMAEDEIMLINNDLEENTIETIDNAEENIKNGDEYLQGESITIDYIINGNLFVIADSVTIDAEIRGDAFIIADSVKITNKGIISTNLFTITKNLEVDGLVYDLYSLSDNISISGYITRDIKAFTNNLKISGTIGKDAFLQCDNIEFSDKGLITGNLNYNSENELNISKDSVSGNINFVKQISKPSETIYDKFIDILSFVITVVLIWLILSWLAPKFVKTCNKILTAKPLKVIGIGILTPVILLLAFIVLAIFRITSTFALLILMLLIILLMINSSIFTIAINNIICNKLKIEKTPAFVGILVVCSIIIGLIRLIPILGIIFTFAISILGFGIIVSNLILKLV